LFSIFKYCWHFIKFSVQKLAIGTSDKRWGVQQLACRKTPNKTMTLTQKKTKNKKTATMVANGGKEQQQQPATSSSSNNTSSERNKAWSTNQTLLVIIGGSCIASGIFNILHAHFQYDAVYHAHGAPPGKAQQQHHKEQHDHHPGQPGNNAMHLAMHDFMKGSVPKKKTRAAAAVVAAVVGNNGALLQDEEDPEGAAAYRRHDVDRHHQDEEEYSNQQAAEAAPPPSLAKLSCEKYGGPADEFAQEMVYWQDIPSDTQYVSPFHPLRKAAGSGAVKRRRYMTFEPDGGGWNNIRMALETVLGLAIAMGRTLVLPPAQRLYLLGKAKDEQKTHFGFADFFPMHELAAENQGLEIISMQEFLETDAMTGHLRNKESGLVEFPPNNRTDWDGGDTKLLREWLRNVTHTPIWSPDSCMAAFPASGDHKDVEQLHAMVSTIHKNGVLTDTVLENPTPVDASAMERMRENLRNRKELCVYDEQMQNEHVVHFMCYHKLRVRMLVHFYAFLFFEDWREDVWMKRFMRDHVRYVDEIQCAAARIVHAMHEYTKTQGVASGEFNTMHIRRGDFQFKQTRIDAAEIYHNIKDAMPEKSIVFIATDERDKKFFDPLRQHYDIKFLDDFKHLLQDVNTNHFGMIDQLVASRGHLFFGCWHSTFTGFIVRVRGYHSSKDMLAGHEKGLLPTTYYYVTKDKLKVMHEYTPLSGAFFNREFPTSWRDIDKGIGNHPTMEEDDHSESAIA
jgi:GDP-fucose protein O-fucosyltransferase